MGRNLKYITEQRLRDLHESIKWLRIYQGSDFVVGSSALDVNHEKTELLKELSRLNQLTETVIKNLLK